MKKKWVSLTLVAIVLPISLLTAFKLTGIMPEAITPETFTVEAKSWNGERPLIIHGFNDWVENYYSDDLASVEFKVSVGTYCIGDSTWNWHHFLNLHIVTTANVSKGFVHSMSVNFVKGNSHTSAVPINKDPELLELHNLQLAGSRNAWSGTREAFILTTAKDSPKDCRLVFNVDWIFINQDVDDNLTATLETTYFNGTTYRKILMPIQFLLRTDAGNTFETARAIMPGYYQGHLWLWDDSEDYYAVFLEKDQTINLQATAKLWLSFDLYVYDPDKNLIANLSIDSNETKEVIFKTQSTGTFFIRFCGTRPSSPQGTYIITVTNHSNDTIP